MKDFLYRVCYRLTYTMISVIVGSVLMLFFPEYRVIGVWGLFIGVLGAVIFNYFASKMSKKNNFDTDENGNAKPNYR